VVSCLVAAWATHRVNADQRSLHRHASGAAEHDEAQLYDIAQPGGERRSTTRANRTFF
jgi:hypothetical protein